MSFKNYNITKEYKQIYFYLKENHFSENYIKNLRKQSGFIKINNKNSNMNMPLKIGDVLSIKSSPNVKTDIQICNIPLNIVYEDIDYLLVYKESGIACMPTKSHYTNNLAGAICNYMFNKDKEFSLRILNRLDKDTAGIIIIAKNSIAQKDIQQIDKTYTAICQGKIDKYLIINKKIETLTINGINNIKRIISENVKDATTEIYPIKYNQNMSLIELKLQHGRTHQIRVHLSSINHPLVGDSLYGEPSSLINHTALICNKISFYHPYKKEYLTFNIPYPNDFKYLSDLI